MRRLFADIAASCEGRRWWVRAPAVPFFSYVWWRHGADPLYRSVFSGLNLGIHELGHFVFGPFGDVIGALGGSLLQCFVPLVAMAMFVRQRDVFAVMFAWGWLATNLFEVATYAGDAVTMRLPLVTPGGGHPIHDWNYVLGATGRLRQTEGIADALRMGANLSMLLGMGGMIAVLSQMRHAGRRRGSLSRETRGGGLAARPRETALRPRREPAPPRMSAPSTSSVGAAATPSPRAPDAERWP